MTRKHLRHPLIAALLLALGGAQAQELHEIRLYPSENYTRLVFEVDALPPYRLSILSDPDRLVFDVYLRGGDELLRAIDEKELKTASYLKDIRTARFDKDRLRVVFDLASGVSYSLFSLEPFEQYGHRVVLDVSPKNLESANAGLLSDLGFSGHEADSKIDVPRQDRARDEEFVVMIDAGHGGEDPGATNKFNMQEKHIVLDIAKRTHALLNETPNMQAHLTRDGDFFLPLASRVRQAHRHGADLFISIHADSFKNSRPRGSSVFVLSRKGASSEFAKSLAEQENLADKIGGINVSGTRNKNIDQSLTGIFKDGKERASRQYARLAKRNLGQINTSHGEHIHSAGFAVLKSPTIPSALIEVGFMSNDDDARLLADRAFRARVAEQIAASVILYREHELSGKII